MAETEFILDVDRGAIIEKPVNSTFQGDEIVWAMCRTGDGWGKRAERIVELLNLHRPFVTSGSDSAGNSRSSFG